MTVQDMDICLNITAEPAGKKTRRDDDSILNLMKGQKKQTETSKRQVKTQVKRSPIGEAPGVKKRVKQKHLSAIVAQRLRKSNIVSQPSGVQKKVRFKTETVNTEDTKQKKQRQEVNEASLNVDKKDTKADQSITSSKVSTEPVISFAKVTSQNFGKTILARKRNVKETDSKKTLSSIFNREKGSSNEEIKLFGFTGETDKEQNVIPMKKTELVKSKKPSLSTKKVDSNIKNKKKFAGKSANQGKVDDKETHSSHKLTGKISSLFGHNPEIPNIGQRLVKPINEPVFAATTFTDLNVHPFMISNLEQNMHITKMTIVQQKAIPQILSRKDVLVRSQTGSGKTLVYALPIVELLHKIRPKLDRKSGLRALIVVPTRELALQTYECFLKLIKPFLWIVPGYLAGGEKRKAEKARLRKGCNVLVGTPGRLLDHIQRTESLKLGDVKYFVLDEADRMFDMGYEKDISGIVSALKISTPNENTNYDAMQILRQNVKKVFTDADVEHSKEDSHSIKETQADESKDQESEDDTNRNDVIQKRVYNSSSDEDSEEDKSFVKSKKSEGRKSSGSTELNESSLRKNSVQQRDDDDSSIDQSRRQTILLSATLTQAVEKLAGLAMDHPVFVDAAKENLQITGDDVSDLNEDLVVPQSVVQTYIVTPPKLRMVTLSAYIAGKCQSHGQHKILVFMATQDMVDYHTEILSAVLGKPIDEDDEDSDPLVDVEFFRLHGSMTQKERVEVFKTFRQASSGVLFCTDVAARGLDLPKVDCVVQYTGPISARDYVHRIGRTARAGSSGSATIFLTPPEIEFVRMLESRRIRIKQESMDDVLDKLLTPLSKQTSAHSAAIALQNDFETLVLEDPKLRGKACKAYVSWIRFYSSYPTDMREVFNRRDLHLGHFAKSFALRETPQRIGGIGKRLHEDSSRPQHNNRLAHERPDGVSAKKPHRRDDGTRMGLLKKVRMLNTSEYDSGLEPVKKPKKA